MVIVNPLLKPILLGGSVFNVMNRALLSLQSLQFSWISGHKFHHPKKVTTSSRNCQEPMIFVFPTMGASSTWPQSWKRPKRSASSVGRIPKGIAEKAFQGVDPGYQVRNVSFIRKVYLRYHAGKRCNAPINRRWFFCLIHLRGSPLAVPHLPKKKQKKTSKNHQQPWFIFLPNPICPQRIFGAKLIEKMPKSKSNRKSDKVEEMVGWAIRPKCFGSFLGAFAPSTASISIVKELRSNKKNHLENSRNAANWSLNFTLLNTSKTQLPKITPVTSPCIFWGSSNPPLEKIHPFF